MNHFIYDHYRVDMLPNMILFGIVGSVMFTHWCGKYFVTSLRSGLDYDVIVFGGLMGTIVGMLIGPVLLFSSTVLLCLSVVVFIIDFIYNFVYKILLS